MTLEKELILRLNVGHNTVIRDVQLWREFEDGDGQIAVKNCLAEVVGMVNIDKLPFWLDRGQRYQCFTTSETSVNYFRAKLMRQRHRNRGIVCKVTGSQVLTKEQFEYFLFYKRLKTDINASFEIESMVLHLSTKHELDKKLIPLSVDELQSVVPSNSGATRSIESILEKNKRQRILKSNSLNKQVLLNDQQQQFVSLLSQCILSGLRLRGVPRTQHEKLYKMTYKASEFAFREELGETEPISFESIQDCVETLLKLFTKT
ncbi:Sld7 [Kluyveromyces lactis]|nr:Sld7 [Kluyveromyces lactis]